MNRFNKAVITKSIVAGAMTLALSASALNMTYEVGGGSVTANSTDPGLVVDTYVLSSVAGTSFDLENGGSATFGFFKIWTDESTINTKDDLAGQNISATLNFSMPSIGVNVQGITFGGTAFFGLAQYGKVVWNGPVTIDVGDRVFEVSLSDEIFNAGFLGLNQGRKAGAIVDATITQKSSPDNGGGTPLPDGGLTVALLGLGLAALGGFTRTLKA